VREVRDGLRNLFDVPEVLPISFGCCKSTGLGLIHDLELGHPLKFI
jgi:hypothetical protein